MSRIGKKPITIPAGVEVKLNGNNVTVKGAKGTLTRQIDTVIGCEISEKEIVMVCPEGANSDVQAKHGLYRALCANMVKGVTEGFKKTLIVNGVGWKVAKQGKKVVLNVGFSHPVEIEEIDGLLPISWDKENDNGHGTHVAGTVAAATPTRQTPVATPAPNFKISNTSYQSPPSTAIISS